MNLDRVGARGEIGDPVDVHAAPDRRIEDEDIVAPAAGQPVVSGSAVHPVIVGAAEQSVAAIATQQHVVAGAAAQPVVEAGTEQRVGVDRSGDVDRRRQPRIADFHRVLPADCRREIECAPGSAQGNRDLGIGRGEVRRIAIERRQLPHRGAEEAIVGIEDLDIAKLHLPEIGRSHGVISGAAVGKAGTGAVAVDPNRIVAVARVDGGARTGGRDGVASLTCLDAVVAGTAIEHIVAGRAQQAVVELVAGEHQPRRPQSPEHFDFLSGLEPIVDARMDDIGAGAGRFDDPIVRIVDEIGIVPAATVHRVGPQSAVEPVVAEAARERVAASAAPQAIRKLVAGPREIAGPHEAQPLDLGTQHVGRQGGPDRVDAPARRFGNDICRIVHVVAVIAVPTGHRVDADAPIEPIVAEPADQRVVVGAAVEPVIAGKAVDPVVAAPSVHHVIARRGHAQADRVIAGCPPDHAHGSQVSRAACTSWGRAQVRTAALFPIESCVLGASDPWRASRRIVCERHGRRSTSLTSWPTASPARHSFRSPDQACRAGFQAPQHESQARDNGDPEPLGVTLAVEKIRRPGRHAADPGKDAEQDREEQQVRSDEQGMGVHWPYCSREAESLQ